MGQSDEAGETTTEPVNPAAQLLNLIERASKLNAANLRIGWSKVLGVGNPQDTGPVLRAMGTLYELIEEVRRLVLRLPTHKQQRHLQALTEIESWFANAGLETSWQGHRAMMKIETIRSIGFTADELHHFSATRLTADVLRNLLNRLNELIEEVVGSDIDDSLKSICLRPLSSREGRFSLTGCRETKDCGWLPP